MPYLGRSVVPTHQSLIAPTRPIYQYHDGILHHQHVSIFFVIVTESSIWVNYSDLSATSLEIMVNKGNHPQMALIQVSEIL